LTNRNIPEDCRRCCGQQGPLEPLQHRSAGIRETFIGGSLGGLELNPLVGGQVVRRQQGVRIGLILVKDLLPIATAWASLAVLPQRNNAPAGTAANRATVNNAEPKLFFIGMTRNPPARGTYVHSRNQQGVFPPG